MRDGYQRERTSFLIWLVSALVAGFVVQQVFSNGLNVAGFESTAALSAAALKQGEVWTLVTHPFLHRGALHVLGVVLAIFFVGRELVVQVGERRLFWLAVAAAVVGGLVWFGFHFDDARNVEGATTILWCYFTVFACLFPNREISFLVFFVLPITTRPKYVLWTMLAIDLVGALFVELQPDKFPNYFVPHTAHFGAVLIGWLYYRYVHDANWLVLRPRADIELPRWMKRSKKPATAAAPAYQLNAAAPGTAREDIRAEVDRILDKINSHGFGSLTPQEKRVLDDAKDVLSRR